MDCVLQAPSCTRPKGGISSPGWCQGQGHRDPGVMGLSGGQGRAGLAVQLRETLIARGFARGSPADLRWRLLAFGRGGMRDWV